MCNTSNSSYTPGFFLYKKNSVINIIKILVILFFFFFLSFQGSGPNQQQSNKKNKKKGQDTPKTPIQNDLKTTKQKTPGSEGGSPQQKKKLDGGIIIKDLKEGTGPVAKNGQLVSQNYTCLLLCYWASYLSHPFTMVVV